jgi:hypothetical protein
MCAAASPEIRVDRWFWGLEESVQPEPGADQGHHDIADRLYEGGERRRLGLAAGAGGLLRLVGGVSGHGSPEVVAVMVRWFSPVSPARRSNMSARWNSA